MAYGDFKDLTRRIASDKILRDEEFSIAKNPNYDGYQCGLVSVIYKFSDKKTSAGAIRKENVSNKELAEELHKPIIKNFKTRKLQPPFIDNIWGTDLADKAIDK